MREKLKELLMIPPGHLDGVIKDLSLQEGTPNGVRLNFHYVQLQGSNIRIDDFVSILQSGMISYCLKREDARHVDYILAPRRYVEARETFVRGEKSGELGELALYLLLESKLCAPQILSKMSLKTSGNLHANGSDAVHMGIDDAGYIVLYLGEAKVYKSLQGSIDACMKSIEDFYFDELVDGRSQFQFDLKLVSSNLDVDDEVLRRQIIDLLDPWTGGKENLLYVNACFIAFECPGLVGINNLSPIEAQEQLIEVCEQQAKDICRRVNDIMERKNRKGLLFLFFFMPFPDVADVKSKFRAVINAK